MYAPTANASFLLMLSFSALAFWVMCGGNICRRRKRHCKYVCAYGKYFISTYARLQSTGLLGNVRREYFAVGVKDIVNSCEYWLEIA
jgi:hypothetical protein